MADQVHSIRIVDHARSVIAGLDSQAARQAAADRGVPGLDPGVDDRDRHASPVPVPEGRAPVHRPEGTRPEEAGARVRCECVAPGGEGQVAHRPLRRQARRR